MSPVLSTPNSPRGLVELYVFPKGDTLVPGAESDLSTVVPMTLEQVSPSIVHFKLRLPLTTEHPYLFFGPLWLLQAWVNLYFPSLFNTFPKVPQ